MSFALSLRISPAITTVQPRRPPSLVVRATTIITSPLHPPLATCHTRPLPTPSAARAVARDVSKSHGLRCSELASNPRGHPIQSVLATLRVLCEPRDLLPPPPSQPSPSRSRADLRPSRKRENGGASLSDVCSRRLCRTPPPHNSTTRRARALLNAALTCPWRLPKPAPRAPSP